MREVETSHNKVTSPHVTHALMRPTVRTVAQKTWLTICGLWRKRHPSVWSITLVDCRRELIRLRNFFGAGRTATTKKEEEGMHLHTSFFVIGNSEVFVGFLCRQFWSFETTHSGRNSERRFGPFHIVISKRA